MAKGIITKKPDGGGTAGRIVVTDGTAASDRDVAVAIELGTPVEYSEVSLSTIGDIVDFTYDGRLASAIKTLSKCVLISGNYTDNIVVNAREATLILGGNVEGKITINGGILAVSGKSFIAGKIESAVAGSFVLIDSGTSIEGKLEVIGASTLTVKDATIDGKVSSSGNTFASVTGSTIRGKLEVINAKVCKCSGNTVEGITNTPGCTA